MSDVIYRVSGGGFKGWGRTAGLALRRFWRSIEDETLAGRDAPFHYLPQRRQDSVRRRAARRSR